MSSRRRILIIDDNDSTLDLLEVFLFRQYDILTAQNGFDGLKVAQEQRPDLIVTDIMMPVMDGIAFFNELRRRKETAHIPVVAVTSFAEPTTVKSLTNVGFAGVVAKPFQRDAILSTVAGIVEQGPPGATQEVK
jgi:CheY-like chemotaxis protein